MDFAPTQKKKNVTSQLSRSHMRTTRVSFLLDESKLVNIPIK